MASITIWSFIKGTRVEVEMPAVTTAGYAALRLAEAAGLDPDAGDWDWCIIGAEGYRIINETEIMAPWDGKQVVLGLASRGL